MAVEDESIPAQCLNLSCMYFEFSPNPGFNFLQSFGQKFGIESTADVLVIPPEMGEGYIRIVDLYPHFKLLIHRYRLREDLILRRTASSVPSDLVSVIFNSNEEPANMYAHNEQVQFSRHTDFAIQISSTDLSSEVRFSANREIYFTVVGMAASQLRSLLQLTRPHSIVDAILGDSGGYLFYESMTPDVQKVLKQMMDFQPGHELQSFFYRNKVQELLFFLFEKLLRREGVQHLSVNKEDADALYLLRSKILADLSQPPFLPQLAKSVGMSETKMKQLFRQVFGNSIYQHFQDARMEQAAFLLRDGSRTVADVGYQLGFSNLSHFGRLFEKYTGMKPKKYALAG